MKKRIINFVMVFQPLFTNILEIVENMLFNIYILNYFIEIKLPILALNI